MVLAKITINSHSLRGSLQNQVRAVWNFNYDVAPPITRNKSRRCLWWSCHKSCLWYPFFSRLVSELCENQSGFSSEKKNEAWIVRDFFNNLLYLPIRLHANEVSLSARMECEEILRACSVRLSEGTYRWRRVLQLCILEWSLAAGVSIELRPKILWEVYKRAYQRGPHKFYWLSCI